MLKAKGIVLLKYLVVLVVAGVVGYLAGHWGTGQVGDLKPRVSQLESRVTGASQPRQPAVSLEARLTKLELEVFRRSAGSSYLPLGPSLEDRVRELERRTEGAYPFPTLR